MSAVDPARTSILQSHLLGMPQLAYGGLSEAWLLRQLGDMHWSLIGRYLELEPQAICDTFGNRLYPAFVAIRLRNCAFGAAREGDSLEIASAGEFVSRKRFYSRHVGMIRGKAVLQVELLSIFLKRQRESDNSGLVSAEPTSMRHAVIVRSPPQGAETLLEAARAARQGANSMTRLATPAPVRFLPCPSIEFNGAKILYFAYIPSIMDRAENAWLFDCHLSLGNIVGRDLFILSNANVGDVLTVEASVFDISARGDCVARVMNEMTGNVVAVGIAQREAPAALAAATGSSTRRILEVAASR
ncbi:MAG: Pnap_2097 family protein [Rhizomicrobium sp.]